VNDVHGSARQDVGRADENRVADLTGEILGCLETADLGPRRLVDTDSIENGGELVAVLSDVDLVGISTKYSDAAVLETKSNVLGQLT